MSLRSIILEAIDENDEILSESGCSEHVKNIFEDEKITFGEIRDIFKSIFNGSTNLYEKCDGVQLSITYKDGGFKFARNRKTLREPMDYEKLQTVFEGNPKVKEAFVNSANDLGKALQALDTRNLNRLFANGKNFLNVEIVYPPVRNIVDYGNKCLLQLNSVDVYDDGFQKVAEDTAAAEAVYEMMKNHNALKQEMFEISKPNVLRIKNSVDAEDAMTQLSEDIDKLVDGIGYRSTIQDYVNDRLRRYIVNCAMKQGIDVDKNSDFVNELADRISYVSHRRPTKTDLVCYGKKAGIDTRSENYKTLINTLSQTSEEINDVIMKPIEQLVMKASVLLFKNLVGFMAADPNKTTQRIVGELDQTIKAVEADNSCLTKEKMKRFHKNMMRLEEYQKDGVFPTEGVIFRFRNKNNVTRVYKMTGTFGPINQLMHILNH